MSFVENARHQIPLSQSLRRRQELMQGTMLVEQPYKDQPPIEAFAAHALIGDAHTVAERLTVLIHAARSRHIKSIEQFAQRVRPMVERELGPLDQLGIERVARGRDVVCWLGES